MQQTPSYELKAIACELKELDETGYFEGKAAVYSNVDNGGDLIEPGAFSKTIAERGSKIPILAEHKDTIGSGQVFDAGTYLGIRGRILMSIQKGREYAELAKAGIVSGLSIGYRTVKYKDDLDRKVRRLLELKLYEVSLVTFPMNELALVTTAKQTPVPEASMDNLTAALRIIRDDLKAGMPNNPITRALRELRLEGRLR